MPEHLVGRLRALAKGRTGEPQTMLAAADRIAELENAINEAVDWISAECTRLLRAAESEPKSG